MFAVLDAVGAKAEDVIFEHMISKEVGTQA
jgi:hypothetical protein